MPSTLPRTPVGRCAVCFSARPLVAYWAWIRLCDRCAGPPRGDGGGWGAARAATPTDPASGNVASVEDRPVAVARPDAEGTPIRVEAAPL
jgi:hypothetical protein